MNLSFNAVIVCILLTLGYGFMLDKDNYFYINTSYTRQTVSLSLCFKLNRSTTISAESPQLVPQGNHRFEAVMENHQRL